MHAHFITILIFFAIHAILYAASGLWLFFHRKDQHDHSRLLLGSFSVLMAVSCIIFIATAFFAPAEKQFEQSMLEPYPSILSFIIWTLLPLYIYEINNPKRLTLCRLMAAYSPWLALCLGFIGWHASTDWITMTPLTSFDAIARNIQSTEVILRVALAAIFLPYGQIIFIKKMSWRETNAPQPWMNILRLFTGLFTLTFIFGMLCRINLLMYLHVLVTDVIIIISLYMEAHVRIPVPETSDSDQQEANVAITNIALKLQQIMQTGIWHNPEFNRDDFCRLVGTNRVYLAKAVRTLGYENFSDMLNQYRIENLHQMMEQNPKANVSDLVFQAGFRSHETANRQFVEKYGCTIAAFRRGG